IVQLTLTGSGGKRSHALPIQAGMIRDRRIEVPFTIRAKRGGVFSLLARVADPNTKGAMTCSCGCGGTPRPACAHSCGGNPCTGG
ncbi:MAG: hypothetical protein ACRD3I_06765, partial [Terriglobales bacterium]